MSSPWKTQTCPPAGPSSLRDIMSEQLAVDEETQEDRDLALALKESLELEQAGKRFTRLTKNQSKLFFSGD